MNPDVTFGFPLIYCPCITLSRIINFSQFVFTWKQAGASGSCHVVLNANPAGSKSEVCSSDPRIFVLITHKGGEEFQLTVCSDFTEKHQTCVLSSVGWAICIRLRWTTASPFSARVTVLHFLPGSMRTKGRPASWSPWETFSRPLMTWWTVIQRTLAWWR